MHVLLNSCRPFNDLQLYNKTSSLKTKRCKLEGRTVYFGSYMFFKIFYVKIYQLLTFLAYL